MSTIDELELGKTLGRVEQKVDAVIAHVGELKKDFSSKIKTHDAHIQSLLADRSERRGAAHVWYLVYSFCAVGFWKLIDHIPHLLKSILG